jgi:hypothetical protein
LFASQDKFPAGATCWQKQVQLSTQDYIESYPTQNLSHVSVGSNIIRKIFGKMQLGLHFNLILSLI